MILDHFLWLILGYGNKWMNGQQTLVVKLLYQLKIETFIQLTENYLKTIHIQCV